MDCHNNAELFAMKFISTLQVDNININKAQFLYFQ